MITAPFFAAFNFVANNKWAQIVLTVGLVLVAIKIRDKHRDARAIRRERARGDDRAGKYLDKVERKSDERLEKANTARANVRGTSNYSELPERTRRALEGAGKD